MKVAAAILGDVGRGLLWPRFLILVGLSVALWAAAYQHKREYVVEVADTAYHPYIEEFNDIETSASDPPFDYRWSKAAPQVKFPGIGNEPVDIEIVTRGARPVGDPPLISWSARGESFGMQTDAGQKSETFFLDRGANAWDGDLTLAFTVPTFDAPGDPRELGVIIERLIVRPADYGLRPFIIPSLGTLVGLLAGIVGLYLLFVVAGVGRAPGLVIAGASALLGSLGILLVRPDTALLAASLPSLMLWGIGLAVIGRLACESWIRNDGSTHSLSQTRGMGWAVVAFVLAFLVRFGGLTYPQFLTSDIILHSNNAQGVIAGEWVFTEPLPDGRPVPYPPAYYLLLALLSPITGTSTAELGLALKWTASLLDALSCLALAWTALRLWPRNGHLVSSFAAPAYLASPGILDLFSAGNYTNLFSQSVQNLTLLGALVFLSGRGFNRVGFGLLALGFFLTVLGHYGMLIATFGVLGIFFVWTIVNSFRKVDPEIGLSWSMLGVFGVAFSASVAVYYWRFLDVMWGQIADVFDRLFARGGSGDAATNRGSLLDGLSRLPEKMVQLSGGLLVLTGGFGAALLPGKKLGVRALLVSWLGAALVFAMLDRVLGDSVRWYYLAAAPLALLAGRFLALLGMRKGWASKLAILVLAAALLQMIQFWVDLIYVRYH